MKLFDENGNFIGEFIEEAKENVSDSFEISWVLGILCFLWQPIWTIVVIAIWLFFKTIFKICKFILRIIWWFIRVPFCLIFSREWPEF